MRKVTSVRGGERMPMRLVDTWTAVNGKNWVAPSLYQIGPSDDRHTGAPQEVPELGRAIHRILE